MENVMIAFGGFAIFMTMSCEEQTIAEELPAVNLEHKKPEPIAKKEPLRNELYQPAKDRSMWTTGDKILLEAREYLGVPYEWGGRSKDAIDCLGLTSLVISSTSDVSWKKFPVNPSEFPNDKKYGSPVSDLAPVLQSEVNDKIGALEVGDFIAFLLKDYHHRLNNRKLHVCTEINELGDSIEYGGWHTAIYTGNGNVIHAKPGSTVIEESIRNIHFDALYVKRHAATIPVF
jgi:cell wall-associated NlpC family hydrolase